MGRHDMAHGELTQFIKWKDAYGTRVELIDKQHLNILEFLNTWYNEVRGGAFTENVARQMNEKFQYLDDFTHGHLDFESKLLKVLKERCGFPQGAYREHLEIHYRFVSQLMKPLAEQVNIRKAWKSVYSEYAITKKEKEIESFNKSNVRFKKGMA
jgi:hemerythrin